MNYEQVKMEHIYVINRIKELEQKRKKYPAGDIISGRNGKSVNWYLKENDERRYIKKSEKKLIRDLILKKYETSLLNDLKQEEILLNKYEKFLKGSYSEKMLSPDSVYQIPLLDYYRNTQKDIDLWKDEEYTKSDYKKDALKLDTSSGNAVRSKSESMIEMVLNKYKIPFRYENIIVLNGIRYIPDYTIKHPKTGKIYIWEHLGCLNDPEYVKDNAKKIRDYINSGWLPGQNLIISSELLDRPLSELAIDKIVRAYFL